MKASDQKRFDSQYQKHLQALKLNNYSDTTIDVYSRARQAFGGLHRLST